MEFAVYGPYEIKRNRKLISTASADKREFWETVESDVSGLSDACGCYVFAVRGRVWHVGKAEKQAFRDECFTSHKLLLCSQALQCVTGKPSLYFVAKLTPSQRFAKPSYRGHGDIHLLETLLIGVALRRNAGLQNIRGTKLLRDMNVPGILNTRQGQARGTSVQGLKHVLGVNGK